MREQIVAALARLGSTPSQIAWNLHERKIKGIRGSASACPISRYLRLELNTESIKTLNNVIDYSPTERCILLERHQHDFVVQFDSSLYPHLISF